MSPRSKEANRQIAAIRREQILNAAAKVFSRNGFAGAKTAEIAVEAGISEGLIFRHFKNKDAILIEILKKTPVPAEILENIIKLNISPLDKIRMYFYLSVQILTYNSDALFIRNIVHQAKIMSSMPKAAKKIIKDSINNSPLELLIPVIEEGQKLGQIRQHDPEKLSTACFSMFEGWSILQMYGKNNPEYKTPVLDIDLITQLLKNPDAGDAFPNYKFKRQLKSRQVMFSRFKYQNTNNEAGSIKKYTSEIIESEAVKNGIRIISIKTQDERGKSSITKLRADDLHPLYREDRDIGKNARSIITYTDNTVNWDYPVQKIKKTTSLNGEFYDGESLLSLLPAFPFDKNGTISLVLIFNEAGTISGDYYPLDIKNNGIEKISVPAGDFDCYNLELFLGFHGEAKKTFSVNIYMSVQEPHFPVRSRYVQVNRESISELVEYE